MNKIYQVTVAGSNPVRRGQRFLGVCRYTT
jgi:hypothetical protein